MEFGFKLHWIWLIAYRTLALSFIGLWLIASEGSNPVICTWFRFRYRNRYRNLSPYTRVSIPVPIRGFEPAKLHWDLALSFIGVWLIAYRTLALSFIGLWLIASEGSNPVICTWFRFRYRNRYRNLSPYTRVSIPVPIRGFEPAKLHWDLALSFIGVWLIAYRTLALSFIGVWL